MLFVVATPIGNLEDITLRALKTLKEVDAIAAEDTRQTRKLLEKYQIHTPLISFHQHSEDKKLNKLIEMLKAGQDLAVVTDAGTPGIADPGGILVALAHQEGIPVIPIPGPSSITAILSAAGVPADTFFFVGFLPKKKGRASLWKEIANLTVPVVIFESPHRIARTLDDIVEHLGDRDLIIGRELTKAHEEIIRQPASRAIQHFQANPPRGEFVIVIT